MGNSGKVYHAAIEPRDDGFVVTFAYGRRGNTLTTGTKTTHPVSLAEALECLGRDSGAAKSGSTSRMARAERWQIGSTLCLGDELSPGICRHPTGRFCVIMPMRVTTSAGELAHANATADDTPEHQEQAAA